MTGHPAPSSDEDTFDVIDDAIAAGARRWYSVVAVGFLFHERSLAMGWLDDVATAVRKTAGGVEEKELGAAGLWSMNDAGRDHPLAAPEASLVAWFQVGVEPVSGDRPLPVQPFLRCAGDAAARIGTLRLQAVQVLLPVQGLDTSSRPEYARMPSLLTVGWFGDCDPQSRTPVRVTLDSGQAPSIPSADLGDRLVGQPDQMPVVDHDRRLRQQPTDRGGERRGRI